MNEGRATVLVAPLDWGLGHATRDIAIIRYLVETERHVVLAVDGRPRLLLEAEFPDLEIIPLPSYGITYPTDGSMASAMAQQMPKIIRGAWIEHHWLKRWAAEAKPDLIISDNRFGLWHKSIPTVYITHQLNILTPPNLDRLKPALSFMHQSVIKRYTECWIPDFEDEPNFGGELSHSENCPANVRYIGPLTRFSETLTPSHARTLTPSYDLLAILSGPEPQRSLFEELILKQLPALGITALIVAGRTEDTSDEWVTDKIRLVGRMTQNQLEGALAQTKVVMARSGSSTVMDLAVFGKPVIFVPTPGQTEQEHFAKLLTGNPGVVTMDQRNFDLKSAWKEVQTKSGFTFSREQTPSFVPYLESLLARKNGR